MARLPEALARHARAFREELSAPRARLAWATFAFVAFNALLVARLGTVPMRIAAGSSFVVFSAVVFALSRHERRALSSTDGVLTRVVAPAAPREAEKIRRALTLLEKPDPGSSRALAELHVARSLASVPHEEILGRARKVSRTLRLAFALVAALAFGSCVRNPWGLVEGADVLVSRGGRAPLDLAWLSPSSSDVHSRPPDYLHREEHHDAPGEELELPRGTLLTFRGTPIHGGRQLGLSDGKVEVPFVDDGAGAVTARWPLADSVDLRVVARFGDVVIEDPVHTKITSIPDAVPTVELAGAPRRISLTKDADSAEIQIKYKAEDDHGLREVHLVLRAGAREERRVLSRLDGETKVDRGGYVLRPSDAFLKRSHVPVEVRVAAKDNDPVTGPKWGESEAILVVPPDVGEPEALRLEALRAIRKGYVEALGYRLSHGEKGDDPVDAGRLRELSEKNAERLSEALGETFAGVRISSRLDARLRLSQKKLLDAENRDAKSSSAATRKEAVVATERMVLVVDAVIRGLGLKDTRAAAKELAEAADDLALGASQSRASKDEKGASARMDASTLVLEGGKRQLVRLGSLGEDLGEIVDAALLRIVRARKAQDLVHTELAAKDLAVRLHQPDPSFGAQGGSSHGGGEAGGGRGAPSEDEGSGGSGGDEAERAFQEAAQELESLAGEHAKKMGEVEQSLSHGSTEEDRKALADEAKKHADAIREAVRSMPQVGSGSDSWTSKGSAAKELAEQMAHALEQGNPADGVASGRAAQGALEEAKRVAQRSLFRGGGAEERLDEAQKKLAPEVKWAEEKLAQMKARARDRARGELGAHGEDEARLAEKAGDLARKAQKEGQGLPQAALDALSEARRAGNEAAQALKNGDVDKGQAAQREAQSKLEAAKRALGSPDDSNEHGDSSEDDGGRRGDPSGHAPIPKADAHKGPEEFRKRVLKGLGQPGAGRQKDAVMRYAEGLLR